MLPTYKVWLAFVKCPASLKWRRLLVKNMWSSKTLWSSLFVSILFSVNQKSFVTVFVIVTAFVTCLLSEYLSFISILSLICLCPLSAKFSFVKTFVLCHDTCPLLVLIMVNLNCTWTWLSITELFHVYASFFWICRKKDISF